MNDNGKHHGYGGEEIPSGIASMKEEHMKKSCLITTCITLFLFVAAAAHGAELTAAQKAKVDAKFKQLSSWSSDKKIVDAVRAFNANPPAATRDMTQEKWEGLSMLSPEVKSISKSELAGYLRTLKDDTISEVFVSGADGTKAAFLSKTTNWSHKGKPKHDVPMSGKTWTGKPELDESTGVQQVQVGLPVLDNGKAIGSIVVGLNLSKL
jgi:hypothetical protein